MMIASSKYQIVLTALKLYYIALMDIVLEVHQIMTEKIIIIMKLVQMEVVQVEVIILQMMKQ